MFCVGVLKILQGGGAGNAQGGCKFCMGVWSVGVVVDGDPVNVGALVAAILESSLALQVTKRFQLTHGCDGTTTRHAGTICDGLYAWPAISIGSRVSLNNPQNC